MAMETQPFSHITPQCLNTSASAPSLRKSSSKDALFFLSEVASAARESSPSPPPVSRSVPRPRSKGTKRAAKALAQQSLSQAVRVRLLAASFKLCPNPSERDVHALAIRVGLSSSDVTEWFERRRRLESWAANFPQLKPSDISAALSQCRQRAVESPSQLAIGGC
jgi:hypothetical protein